LGRFRTRYDFEFDDFQVHACQALQDGRGVLVAAPTGSGKTVVGEFAVDLALSTGRKAFYTTPIKALSNQKFSDLVRRYGPEQVGLLTGDNTINGEAPVVVMTTEVLRNMLYADSPTLSGLGYVVMDEVHYLADRFRGAVWEEVIIHLPDDVLVVSLSATVSNAEEFGAWLDTVRGDTTVVVSEHRPVPLWQHVMVGTRLYDLFTHSRSTGTRPRTVSSRDEPHPLTSPIPDQDTPTGATVNPELRRLTRPDLRSLRTRRERPRDRQRTPGERRTPRRPEAVLALDHAGLLPAIVFIFSRAGCDAAVGQCTAQGVRLTTDEERATIRRTAQERCAEVPEEDRAVLGYWEWLDALESGVAAHHAGLLPTFKEVVEDLFSQGLVKVVFATETLALGVNMPARSVVLEKLVKWNGETHADVTPGEYTQLTGRAGRRGIDVEGHAIVLWHPDLDPDALAGLASARTYPLRSSFRPTYNMAVNLVAQVGRDRARKLLETSFAQFQADGAVVGLARQARRQEEALSGYAEAMRCSQGDFPEYAALRRAISDREADLSRSASRSRRADLVTSLESLRRGDVIRLHTGRHPGWAVVVEPDPRWSGDGPRLTVLTTDRRIHRMTVDDIQAAAAPLARITVPRTFNARDPRSRRDLATTLRTALGALPDHGRAPRRPRSAAATDEELAALRRSLRAHPCHGCDHREDHARWAERWWRLRREHETLLRRIEGRTNTIARTFDRVCELLEERGYLDGDHVTSHGRRLGRIYAESDLLIAECLREGVWRGLDGAGLASCLSALVYSSRRDDGAPARMPGGPTGAALLETERLWSALSDRERDRRLDPTPEPDLGLAWAVHRWARGHRLEAVLSDGDLAAGDFVRWCKQIIDLLGQIQQAAGEDGDNPRLARTAREAVEHMRRGVVAYSSIS
jgi:ATP-dependent RNA helicase HelY